MKTTPYKPLSKSEARKAMLVAIIQTRPFRTILEFALAIPLALFLVECAVYFGF